MRRPPILRWPILRWLPLVAMAFAAQALAQTNAPLTYRAIRETLSSAMALRLLGPEQSADVERIEARREMMLPATVEVHLFHRPVPLGRSYCRQLVHDLYLSTIRHEGSQIVADDDALQKMHDPSQSSSLARAPACRLRAGQRFAAIDPDNLDGAMWALDRLAVAQAAALGPTRRIPFRLTCRDEIERDPDRCRRGVRDVLAHLPLDQACSVYAADDDPQIVEVDLCTDGPLWVVRIDSAGRVPARLSMLWKDPDPF
jgi:hypothetical protein